jgi:hypothetical protein
MVTLAACPPSWGGDCVKRLDDARRGELAALVGSRRPLDGGRRAGGRRRGARLSSALATEQGPGADRACGAVAQRHGVGRTLG